MRVYAILHGIRGSTEIPKLGRLVIGRTLKLIIFWRDRLGFSLLLLLLLLLLLHHWGRLICWRRMSGHTLRSSEPLAFPGAEAEEDDQAGNEANE